jgi:hypothetical protein
MYRKWNTGCYNVYVRWYGGSAVRLFVDWRQEKG